MNKPVLHQLMGSSLRVGSYAHVRYYTSKRDESKQPEHASPSTLTHVDSTGQAHMVSVSGKRITKRSATARGSIQTTAQAIELVRSNTAAKGDVLATARIAGIMAAKRTPDLIPLCHPISLTKVRVELEVDTSRSAIHCTATAECEGVTGVEMEALTACNIALLTVYDMLKAVDKHMQIHNVRVVRKTGGKSGDWQADQS
ncbi:hypothetical protein PYCC9005_002010 [Savitreella phatthalungensis]